jgi:TPR repeat protein
MAKRKAGKTLKLAAGITMLSASLHSLPIHAADDDDELFMMNEVAREYWINGKAGEGLCGSRMQPDIEEMKEEANKGNVITAFRLGQLYEDGYWGVKKDGLEAVKWYEMAAKGGLYSATISLGTIYELGRSVKKDLSKAMYWFMEAQKIMYDDYLAEKILKIQDKLENTQ